MKKLLMVILTISPFASFAMDKIDLAKTIVMCNNTQIAAQPTQDFLVKNCSEVDVKYFTHVSGVSTNNVRTNNGAVQNPTIRNKYSRVAFVNDEDYKMECYFMEDNFKDCKIAKKPQAKHLAASQAE